MNNNLNDCILNSLSKQKERERKFNKLTLLQKLISNQFFCEFFDIEEDILLVDEELKELAIYYYDSRKDRLSWKCLSYPAKNNTTLFYNNYIL